MTQQEMFGMRIRQYADAHNCTITEAADRVVETWPEGTYRPPGTVPPLGRDSRSQSTSPGPEASSPVPDIRPSQNGAQRLS